MEKDDCSCLFLVTHAPIDGPLVVYAERDGGCPLYGMDEAIDVCSDFQFEGEGLFFFQVAVGSFCSNQSMVELLATEINRRWNSGCLKVVAVALHLHYGR